jgi:hypothetical protein
MNDELIEQLFSVLDKEGEVIDYDFISKIDSHLYIAIIVPEQYAIEPYFKVLHYEKDPDPFFNGGIIDKQCRISIYSPIYIPNNDDDLVLDYDQIKKLIKSLNEKRGNLDITNWEWILDTINHANQVDKSAKTIVDTNLEIPDYMRLGG